MTIVTNSATTYGLKGIREELENRIYNISPEETPFMSNCGRGDLENVFFEWQQDALVAPAANAQLEGDDSFALDAVVPTVRLGNYAQISRKSVVVSATAEVVNKAGRKSELAYQLAKKSAELKRDMESIFIGANQSGAVVGSNTVPRNTAGMLAWLKTNVDMGTGSAANPSYTNLPSALRTDGTTRNFTETILKNVHQLAWTTGGTPRTLMVDGPQKQTVSGFTGIATRTFQQTDKVVAAIIGAADVYVGDFGSISVVPNRFQRHRDAWFLDWKYLTIKYLRKFQQVPLAKTGDGEKRMIVVEYGLEVAHEGTCGLAADLN